MSKLSIFPQLILVILYINAVRNTSTTLIDEFTDVGPLNTRNEPNCPESRNHPAFPSTYATNTLDDFRHWHYPKNVIEGNRVIASKKPQHRGRTILSSRNDYLIEYFPTELAKNYSLLRITYSPRRLSNKIFKNRVGMVLKSHDHYIQSFFFDWKFHKSMRAELHISIEFLIKLTHKFQIGSNFGLIIRGPLKIHHIVFLTSNNRETEIPFQIPPNSDYIPKIIKNRRLFINLATIPASGVKESENVLDDFRQWQNPTNLLKGNRVIASTNPQRSDHAILSSTEDYLIEYFPTELVKNKYTLLLITYSTRRMTTNRYFKNRVGMVIRSDDHMLRSFFFDYKYQNGKRVDVHISMEFLIKLMHEFGIGGNLGLIIRGPLKIKQIDFLTAASGGTEIPIQIPATNDDIPKIVKNPQLFINLPPIPDIAASKVKESEHVLDDFRQWQNPTNVLEGNRVIASTKPQRQGHAILSAATDYLIEYFHTELTIKKYSLLRIIYSTRRLCMNVIAKNRVGMVIRSDEHIVRSFFFDWKCQNGKRLELHISIEFLIKLMHKFQIGSNLGLIIRGPLKIHRIDFLTTETKIPFQIPSDNDNIQKIVRYRRLFVNLATVPGITASIVKESKQVLDDFRQWQNPTNVLEGNRVIASTKPQRPGHAILSRAMDYLIEYFPTDHAINKYLLLCITYSTSITSHIVKNRVGMVIRSDDHHVQSYFFDWTYQNGKRVELHISIEFLIKLTHEFQIGSNLGIIIRGPIEIHQIDLLTADSGETKIHCQIPTSNDDMTKINNNRRLFINLPAIPVIAESNVNESKHLLDNFWQWENPTNVLKGNRIIISKNLQHPDVAILSCAKDYLIEYFPTEHVDKNYTSICITYSTTKLNTNCFITKRIGMIQGPNGHQKDAYFFDRLLWRGKKVKMRIPIIFLTKLWSEFRIDCNYGNIICGPIKIHRIELMVADREAPDITFKNIGFCQSLLELYEPETHQVPGQSVSEIDNHVLDLPSFDLDNESPNLVQLTEPETHKADHFPSHTSQFLLSEPETHQVPGRSVSESDNHVLGLPSSDVDNNSPNQVELTEPETHKADHFPSYGNLVDIWPHCNTFTPDNRTYKFMLKYTQFLNNLSLNKIKKSFLLEVNCLNVLKGSYKKMNSNTFSMHLDVIIKSDLMGIISQSTKFYFELLHNEIVALENQLFEPAGDMLYRIIPKRYVDSGVLDYYRFVGRALGNTECQDHARQ